MDVMINKLNKQLHDRDKFDCGEDILNIYLQTRANQEQKKHLTVTYVATHRQSTKETFPILGFYTLSNSSLSLSEITNTVITRDIPRTYNIPTVKLGRLAVDKQFHGKNLGKLLLKDALNKVLNASIISGIKGVEVFAKNTKAIDFYVKLGFINLKHQSKQLFLPIETIRNACELKEVRLTEPA